MCEATTIIAGISALTAAGGAVAQSRAASQQADAQKREQGNETRRQGAIMRDQARLQEQQRQDALEARKRFQNESLNAFTRENIERDSSEAQTGLAAALKAAGERAIPAASGADATAQTGAVSVADASPRGVDARGESTNAFRSALRAAAQRAAGFNDQQAAAQGGLLALGRAQQLGGQRLQSAGENIQLQNAKLAALGRPRQALGLLSSASSGLYQQRAEDASNEGAGLALAGSVAQSLGNLGYSYASSGLRRQQAKPPATY